MASNVAKRTVLITGASRGLGAECCRQYAQSGWAVIAASRGGRLPPGCEEHAASIEAATLDITSPDDVSALAATLEGHAIDVLVNNAGVALDRDANLGEVDYDASPIYSSDDDEASSSLQAMPREVRTAR